MLKFWTYKSYKDMAKWNNNEAGRIKDCLDDIYLEKNPEGTPQPTPQPWCGRPVAVLEVSARAHAINFKYDNLVSGVFI